MAGEEVVAQVGGMEIVDAGVMAVTKVLVQAVDFGQCSVGTVGTPPEAQEVEVRSSKAVANHVHWKAEG